MSGPIRTNISTGLNPFGPQWPTATKNTQGSQSVGEQVQDALFGRRKALPAEADDEEALTDLLHRLNQYRRKLAIMAGDSESDYRLKLAKGTIGMVDQKGTIYLGVGFLKQYKENFDVIIGVLAHEIGHRPKRWHEYKTKRDLSREELDQLCRYEETQADFFAGRALAELGFQYLPLVNFLVHLEQGPHPEYFPAKLRGEVIQEGFEEQKSKARMRKKLWPELDKKTSPRMHIGDY